jgi:hypothetical protein
MQFKVGDKVRWNAEAVNEGLAKKHGEGPFTVEEIDTIPSARLREIPRYEDGYPAWFNFGWLELAPPAVTIDATKTYETRDGRAVRIYATDGGGDYPVHGAIQREDGTWRTDTWVASGETYADGASSLDDLIEVKPEREGWINVYGFTPHASKAAADASAAADRIACLHLKFREGDGL